VAVLCTGTLGRGREDLKCFMYGVEGGLGMFCGTWIGCFRGYEGEVKGICF